MKYTLHYISYGQFNPFIAWSAIEKFNMLQTDITIHVVLRIFFQKLPNFQENLEEMLVLVYVRRSLISVCKAS